jgi:outer membrane protein
MKFKHFNLVLCFVLIFINSAFSQSQTENSMTLDQAIQEVMKNHPLIEQAQERVRASQARVDQSRSTFYPELDAVGQYSRIGPVPSIDIPDLGSFALYPENNYDAHVAARQTLYDFGKRSTQSALARSEKQTAEDNIEQVKSELAYQTVQVFYTILFLQEDIQVLDDEISALNEHLSISEKKAQTGSATDFDVLTTRVRVANANSQKVDVESALQKQTIALKRLMGIPAEQGIELRGDFTSQNMEINPDSLESDALAQRREMILARDAETSLEIQHRLASLGDRPSLKANLLLGVKNGYIPDLNKPKVNWVAGAQVQMPIFNGFRTRYHRQESEANLAAARAHTRDVSQQVRSEVQQALADIRAKQEKIQATQLQLEQAEQALSLAKKQYEIGVITNLDLLDAQTSHLEANLTHLRALYQMVLSRYALDKAAGSKIW